MNNKIAFIVLFAYFTIFSQNFRKERSIIFEEKRDTIINNAKDTWWHKKWSDFIIYKDYRSESDDKYSLFEINYNEVWYRNGLSNEGDFKSMAVTKWNYLNNGYNKKIWKFNTSGSLFKIDDNFIKIIQYGCCSHPSSSKYFCLKTGNYLTNFNTSVQLSSSKSKNRYFGYTNKSYLDSIYRHPNNTKYHGAGFLFCDTSIISKIYVDVDTDGDFVPKINNKGSYIILTFYKDKSKPIDISIDIENDLLKFK
jgi:hypothetical protein